MNLTEAQIETERARRESDERGGGNWCRTVIFIGRRYEMLFWAIKEKPQGCWCGDEGTRTLPERRGVQAGEGVKMWFSLRTR